VRARRPAGAHLPLVLVPGIGGPRGTFHHQVRVLSENRDVVDTNLNPVHAPGIEPIDSAARDVLHLLDVLGLERVDLLGASYGSCVTARVSQLAPQRVRRLVWAAPPVLHHAPWRASFGPGWLFGGAAMKFAPLRYRGDVVRTLVERRIYSPEPDLSEEELLLLAGRASDTEFAPFFLRLASLRDWDWRRLAQPHALPVLVVQGEVENALTPPDVRQALAALAGRPIERPPGKHMPYLSYPEPFNDRVRAFLDD
jgi:pimeloyl-ACP methyl ester carboxylesterase